MPKKSTEAGRAIGLRIRAGLEHFGYLPERGRLSDFAEKYLGDRRKVSMVSNWLKGVDPPGRKLVLRFYQDWGCTIGWLLEGIPPAPAWFQSDQAPARGPISSLQRADDDKTAVRIALESVLLTILGRSQSAAKAFLDDLETQAAANDFSTNHALLGALTDIAEEVRDGLRKDGPARRKGGLG